LYFTFLFLPVLPAGRVGAYYRCGGCGRKFDAEAPCRYEFGSDPGPAQWTCWQCRAANPSQAARCQVCGEEGWAGPFEPWK
jgi:hypothetical protein